jgi:hypothetical protein
MIRPIRACRSISSSCTRQVKLPKILPMAMSMFKLAHVTLTVHYVVVSPRGKLLHTVHLTIHYRLNSCAAQFQRLALIAERLIEVSRNLNIIHHIAWAIFLLLCVVGFVPAQSLTHSSTVTADTQEAVILLVFKFVLQIRLNLEKLPMLHKINSKSHGTKGIFYSWYVDINEQRFI